MKWTLTFLLFYGVVGVLSYQVAAAILNQDQDNFAWAKQIFEKKSHNDDRQSEDCPACKCGKPFINTTSSTRIVSGQEAPERRYPWMTFMQTFLDNGTARCGGAVITNRHVLTAAHCIVTPKELDKIFLTVLDHNVELYDERVIGLEVESFVIHKDYNAATLDNDIAILKIKEPIDLSDAQTYAVKINPICLPKNDDENLVGKMSITPGWGYLTDKGPVSDILMEAHLPIVADGECVGVYGGRVSEKMICAGYADKDVSSCRGDSGGPLQIWDDETETFFTAGIVSWGLKCGMPRLYSVYTKVSKYLDWIKENTKGGCYCN